MPTPSRPLRVYLFIEHYPNPYKPWIDTQVVQMLRAGHDVRIFAMGAYTSTLHDEVRENDLLARTGYLPGTLRGLKAHGLRSVFRLLSSPRRQASRVSAAVQGTSSAKQRLLVASRTLCLPDAEPDVCYIHNLVSASVLTFLHHLYPKTRVCLYFHGGEVGGQPKVQHDRKVFASVDAVITSTRFAAQQAVDRGCDPASIAVVPLGFHLPSYTPSRERAYRPSGEVRFISVGRMSPEKGFRHALKAVHLLLDEGRRGFTYTLVGSGIEAAQLKSFAREHRLNDIVRFVGEKTRAEVAEALEHADAFVLPSIATNLWAETQATVVQEALLMGCLTLTTVAGGVPESNAPQMERFASPPADSDALAARMRDVLSLSAEEMSRLGAAGRAFAAAKYGIEPLMARILAHAMGELAPDDESRFSRAKDGPSR